MAEPVTGQKPQTLAQLQKTWNQRWRKEHENLLVEINGVMVLTKKDPSAAGLRWYLDTLIKQRARLEQHGNRREARLVQRKIDTTKTYIRY